ncbi:YjjG family noncanonical pyrimidine nucleotidase [Flavobacterium sp. J372]|uniref:YjjG family noncanonical pyrimidine nucleotidase n=1 Tax=Flavobacterium sp. J372 TaxID=2898436 RepID=UPI0021516639|nr:YjjG family noncanonical pyrimidine nucleotidase [Flavobacterium sp. J372]MCR5861636.1 YjjG family noncanonical pyrimidine nucleotidase [Flavobacterium sp. J372]
MLKDSKKAIFFDLDHTLWDFEKNSALTFQFIFEKHCLSIDCNLFLEKYVPVNAQYWKLFRDDKITKHELRYGRFRETFSQMGIEAGDELIETLAHEYIEHLPGFNHLYDGAIEVLDYLKEKYSLHIITNGFHEVQEHKLRNSNIAHYFDTVTNSEMAGCKKPNPQIFEFALRAANADKAYSVMIGDCIEADVQGAIDCGLDAIYFNEHRLDAPETIMQVNHLRELKNLL